jgi:putative flippase GtrA
MSPEPRRQRLPVPGSLGFQVGAFLAVGLLQVLVDTAIFIALGAAGVAVVPANVVSRTCGALLGFWLNGRVTFASADGHGLDRGALLRFLTSWLLLTALGSVLLHAVEARFGLHLTWLAKPLVEAFLAVLGFVSLKYFVFARRFR